MHFLCSQLVWLRPKDGSHLPETVLLEEITPSSVVLTGVRNYQPGERLILSAEGIDAEVSVVGCEDRDGDFALRGTFGEGYRWSPQAWTPTHLLEVRDAPKAKAAGAS